MGLIIRGPNQLSTCRSNTGAFCQSLEVLGAIGQTGAISSWVTESKHSSACAPATLRLQSATPEWSGYPTDGVGPGPRFHGAAAWDSGELGNAA